MMRLTTGLASAGLLALAACSPPADSPVADPGPEGAPTAVVAEAAAPEESADAKPVGTMVYGTITWSDQLDGLENKELLVEIRHAGLAEDENGLSRLTNPNLTSPPVAFHVPLPVQPQEIMDTLTLRARVQEGYAILLSTDGEIDISGGTSDLTIELYNPEDLARGAPRPMITPGGTAYTCGGEALTIAVEAGAAYVTFADGNSVKLDKLATADDANIQFSNGRMLVEQAGDSLSFGRGRAMPQPCSAAG
ncbi:MAG: hypothetical protein RLO80_12265 [Hyphomonas sp.]